MARIPVTNRRGMAALLSAMALAWTAGPADGADPDQRDRSERHTREIDRTIEVLGLRAGQAVAEIGAGDGRFSFRFAEVVGPEGRVYANELDESDVRRIRRRAEDREIGHLVAVQGALDDANLPEACCDAIMMRMVYHMLTRPEPMAQSFFRALKPGGRLIILEGDPDPDGRNARGVPANRAGMGIDPQIAIDELAKVGFVLVQQFPDWVGADYALLFEKPAGG